MLWFGFRVGRRIDLSIAIVSRETISSFQRERFKLIAREGAFVRSKFKQESCNWSVNPESIISEVNFTITLINHAAGFFVIPEDGMVSSADIQRTAVMVCVTKR